jgi:hypothetical protein
VNEGGEGELKAARPGVGLKRGETEKSSSGRFEVLLTRFDSTGSSTR